jgi:hypothetical protein
LDAARFIAEQTLGRAAPRPVSGGNEGPTTVVFRAELGALSHVSGLASEDHGDPEAVRAVLYELAEAVISDSYESQPGRARAIAKRVYRSWGRYRTYGDHGRVADEWDCDDPEWLARMGPAT